MVFSNFGYNDNQSATDHFWKEAFVITVVKIFLCLLPASMAISQTVNEPSKVKKIAPEPKRFSKDEIAKECRKYEGSHIGYYGRVFKVEQCRRREIEDTEMLKKLMAQVNIIPVDGDTLIKIPAGTKIFAKKPTRSCKQLDGMYVVFGASEVFLVDKCRKRAFPDWESFVQHRKSRTGEKSEIYEVTEPEFYALKEGREMPSILDEAFKKLLEETPDVDIIPLAEACKGVDGKYVTYYSYVYKIENCRKRSIEPKQFFKKYPRRQIPELSSEQWVSIPNGRPLKL